MGLFPSEGFEKLKQKALDILRANNICYLGVEYIFLAFLLINENLFKKAGVDIEKVVKDILELSIRGETAPESVGVTPRYKIIFKEAQKLAEEEKSDRVEVPHFIKAMFEDENSLPSVVLKWNNIDKTIVTANLDKAKDVSEASPDKQESKTSKKEDKKSFIEKFGKDLVVEAKAGMIDPVIGREKEIDRIKQILLRKTKSNPVLIGEAGVGKTAVVMGIAKAVAEGRVPDQLKDKRIIELNIASVLAGAKYQGEFEERLEKIIKEVEKSKDIILFIDEIHNITGAGRSGSGLDAGNILKPALAKGSFPVIGATTVDEHRKHIESDPALERRFQPVIINEPSIEEAIDILKGLKESFQVHHGVEFEEEALIEAVKLSNRYLTNRNLPDKAIDLIDEAAAKVKIEEVDSKVITKDMIAQVLSSWTGIPVGKMTSQTSQDLLKLADNLREEVIGQDKAVDAVSQTVQMGYSGLANYKKPLGVFLFLGPTGVGKTYLAKRLAAKLFSSEKDLIRLDMSEFMEKHSVAKLIGAPPGYVGYGEEGILTKSVRTKPYSVVLLDEIEKAHPEVFDIFLQVFDEGRLTDSRGRTINFCNTIIVMTSNIGSTSIDKDGNVILVDMEDKTSQEDIMKLVRKTFRAEFLNRIDEVVFFKSLTEAELKKIVKLSFSEAEKRLKEKNINWIISDEVVDLVCNQGYNPAYGARPLERAIGTLILKPLSSELLKENFKEGDIVQIKLNPSTNKIEFLREK
ncbi:MAG: ATP-dependent Clp protease ATP-binding subunit [Armatimonadota bacterium]